MSSRIRADASGPGEGARRSPQEPAERDNVEMASDGRELEQGTQRPSDAPADPSDERQPAEAPAEGDEKPPVSEPDLNGRDQKRIDQLTRERYQAQRERDEALQRLEQWQRQQQRAQQLPSADREAEERAYQRLAQERLQQDFNRDCDNLWQRGVNEYGDAEMQEAKRGVDAVGWGARPDALAALTALPDGHRVYRELAGDLDNAARILSLPPMRMAVELARMSRGDASNADNVSRETHREPLSERRTRAPEPLRPVGGNSARSDKPLSEVSMAEFIRRRDREERGSRIRR